MGMNSFAYGLKINNSFIVKNIITKDNKTVRIFNYPIPVGQTRDLLSIEGIGEDDIKASLLKGEILAKLLSQEISIVKSDIDLTEYNTQQRAFLASIGVNLGVQIDIANITTALYNLITSSSGGSASLWTLVDDGPTDPIDNNAYKEILPNSSPYPTSIIWWTDNTKSQKIVEKLISYTANGVPATITWNVYDALGALAHTIIDTFTYTNNVFESSRVRSIT